MTARGYSCNHAKWDTLLYKIWENVIVKICFSMTQLSESEHWARVYC